MCTSYIWFFNVCYKYYIIGILSSQEEPIELGSHGPKSMY